MNNEGMKNSTSENYGIKYYYFLKIEPMIDRLDE